MKILKSNSRLEILPYVSDVLWDRQAVKELGEAILFDDSQTWLIALEGNVVTGFFVYSDNANGRKIHYMYVMPEFRRLNIASKLYNEFEKQLNANEARPIKAIATRMSLEFFRSAGFTVTKEFVNYYKVQK